MLILVQRIDRFHFGTVWLLLRTVPSFAFAHTFCATWDGLRKSGFLRTVCISLGTVP